MLKRTSYHASLRFNEFQLNEIIIDQHYKLNHPEMNDSLIFRLTMKLDGLILQPTKTSGYFSYFAEEPIYLDKKPYRLIVILETEKHYIGVVNAFRVKENKNGISF